MASVTSVLAVGFKGKGVRSGSLSPFSLLHCRENEEFKLIGTVRLEVSPTPTDISQHTCI